MKLTTKAGRRTVAAAAIASAAILLPAVALASSAGSAAPKAAAAPKTAAVSGCSRSQLTSWLGEPGGQAAGSTYYQLEISNISGRSCTLYGYPGVSAIRSGRQEGSAAARSASHAPALLTLAPRSTVHVILRVTDVGNYSRAACRPRQADALRVFAPGDYASMEFPFSFAACSRRGPVFLHVSSTVSGTGIPGYST